MKMSNSVFRVKLWNKRAWRNWKPLAARHCHAHCPTSSHPPQPMRCHTRSHAHCFKQQLYQMNSSTNIFEKTPEAGKCKAKWGWCEQRCPAAMNERIPLVCCDSQQSCQLPLTTSRPRTRQRRTTTRRRLPIVLLM